MATQNSLYQNRMKIFMEDVNIYPVSCEKLSCGRTDIEWLDAVLAGGTRIVQLRDKISDDRTFLHKAKIFRQKTREANALFIVNNRVDIALLSDADGVHLGNTDLPAEDVRTLAPDLIIGVSANTKEQAASAKQRGASYYNIGPLFPTSTKSGLATFTGPESIPVYSNRSDLPFTVMGGIKLHHVKQLKSLGAKKIAVVTALCQAEDIAAETRRWIQAMTE